MKLDTRQMELLGDDVPAAQQALARSAWSPVENALTAVALAPTWAASRCHTPMPDALRPQLQRFLASPIDLVSIELLARRLDPRWPEASRAFWNRGLSVALALYPDHVSRIRRELGLVLTRMGQHELAIDLLSADQDNSVDFMEQALVGHALLATGRMSEARDAFLRALRWAHNADEAAQLQPFLTSAERLLEFEGQRGGLDARDLHYIQTGGILLQAPEGETGECVSGYNGELELSDSRFAVDVMSRLVAVLRDLGASGRAPTCVVPAGNTASPLSLALAGLLGLPHLSHQRSISWDRPLVVLPRMDVDAAASWHTFLDVLPGESVTFAFSHDWTADLPVADITGVLASSCRFWWEDSPRMVFPAARQLVTSTRPMLRGARTSPLGAYYAQHRKHRLACPLQTLQPVRLGAAA